MDNFNELVPFLVPIILIQVGLIIVALRDLIGRERTKGPKWAWALIILLVNIFGAIVYLAAGREE